MGVLYLYGWDPDNNEWVKVQCDANGKLKIDPALILENPPTEDEDKKAPSSEWAYDHAADAGAHHDKYTDADVAAAPGNRTIVITTGTYDDLDLTNIDIVYLDTSGGNISLRGFEGGAQGKKVTFVKYYPVNNVSVTHQRMALPVGTRLCTTINGSWSCNSAFRCIFNFIYYSVTWYMNDLVLSDRTFLFDTTPTEGLGTKGINSGWAYTHENDDDAHHVKYTDAEALAACGLDGNLYWSCPGIHFDPGNPYGEEILKAENGRIVAVASGIEFVAAVSLPQGATVTGAIVYGSVGMEDVAWYLKRITLSDLTEVTMATEDTNSEDTSISYAEVDNSLYSYLLVTGSTVTTDVINGARITFTL